VGGWFGRKEEVEEGKEEVGINRDEL